MKKKVLSMAKPLAIGALAIALSADGAPPTEFRLFVKGWNETENGRFLFDEQAAKETLASYRTWGVDPMIDLEHLSLDPDSLNYDPDARGWFRLELRDDGSLWAVNVSWTADGDARLREKRQRYVSPCFAFDHETKRITKILNCAITAMPATHDTPALVAARVRLPRDVRKLSTGFSFGDIQCAIGAALSERYPATEQCSFGPWVLDVFDASFVYQHDGKLFELAYVFDGTNATLGAAPVEVRRSYAPAQSAAAPPATPVATNRKNTKTAKLAAGGTMLTADQVKAALDALKSGDQAKCEELLMEIVASAASGGDAGGEGEPPAAAAGAAPGAGGEGAPGDDKEKDKEPAMAAARMALNITGKADVGEAMAELERRSKVAVDLEQREKALAADRAKLEVGERRKLVGELVRLGLEIPATAWKDDKGTIPVDRLANEPIADLRDRVAKLTAARGGRLNAVHSPPVGTNVDEPGGKEFATPDGPYTVSARELASLAKKKIDPATYAATRAAIRARSSNQQTGA